MSRHLVDPELLAYLDQRLKHTYSMESLPTVRSTKDEIAEQAQRDLAATFVDVEVTERYIPGPSGDPDVRILVYRPKAAVRPLPALLWIHGGGYIMGAPEMSDVDSKRRVTALQCAVVSVAYRLAPETPHPGPVEDCYAALRWLYESAADLGIDPGRIAIGGGSAGGGLAAALGLLTRDRGEIPLIFQLLLYPMLDDRTVTTSDPHPHAGKLTWTAESNRFGWSSLIGQAPGGPGVSPYASPARAEDLSGLPPTFISVGAIDLFVEENMEYARRLMRAGVPTELHVYPGAYHGFVGVASAQVTKAFQRDQMNALRRAFDASRPAD